MRPSITESSILVTGGAGFIGSHLVDRLIEAGAKSVIVVDNLFLGKKENLKKAINNGVVFYVDDIEIPSSLDYIFEKHSIDIVFNCATKALNYSFINPKNAFETNVIGVMNLLEHQRKGSFKTLVHFSTSEVYGSALYDPMDENHPIKPTTAYAAGKAASDTALCSWVNMFGLDAFIMRPFNNFGPRQNHEGFMAGVIPITIAKILNGTNPEVHGTGEQSRDFIYVHDTVRAIIELYPKMEKGQSINISTDCQMNMNDLLHKICSFMDYQGQILRKPARNSDVQCHKASNEKIKSMIDFQITPFDQGLRETIKWYQKNIN